jgi:hypothetical protein
VPEPAAADVEARIAELVAANREQLAQLVDQAVERELEALIAERLTAANGVHETEQRSATKICDGCGETKPETAFEKYRRRCRECRRRDRRTAAVEQAPAEPGRPVPPPTPPPPPPPGITATELAEQTPAGLVPTALALELAGAIG